MGAVTKEHKLQFSVTGSKMVHDLSLPAGLKTQFMRDGQQKGFYVLDEFPTAIFPLKSILRHDAEHYGVHIDPKNLTIMYKKGDSVRYVGSREDDRGPATVLEDTIPWDGVDTDEATTMIRGHNGQRWWAFTANLEPEETQVIKR